MSLNQLNNRDVERKPSKEYKISYWWRLYSGICAILLVLWGISQWYWGNDSSLLIEKPDLRFIGWWGVGLSFTMFFVFVALSIKEVGHWQEWKAFLVGLLFSTIGLALIPEITIVGINCRFDSSQPTIREVKVLEKIQTEYLSTSDLPGQHKTIKHTRYQLRISSWHPDKKELVINVNPDLYSNRYKGETYYLKTKPGLFGLEFLAM